MVEVFNGGFLVEKRNGAGFTHGHADMGGVLHGQGDHDRVGENFFDQPRRFEAIHPWHVHIHEDDVWPKSGGEGYGFLAIGRFPCDRDVLVPGQESAEPLPYHGMVVGNKDSHSRTLDVRMAIEWRR